MAKVHLRDAGAGLVIEVPDDAIGTRMNGLYFKKTNLPCPCGCLNGGTQLVEADVDAVEFVDRQTGRRMKDELRK
jgi:hypothetical protein